MSAPVLRQYQERGLSDIRHALTKTKRVLYVSPTGSGKTTLFSEVCRRAVNAQSRVLIVAHRKELIRQISVRLSLFGINHGVRSAGYKRRDNATVQVSMVRRAPRLLQSFSPDLIIVDEAHHAAAGSWQRTLEAAPDAYVLGVSATPCRLDGKGLGDAFDDLIIGPNVRELTDAGYLVPARVWAPSDPDMSQSKSRGGDWRAEDIAKAVEKSAVIGDAVEHYKQICPGKRAVAFCVSVEHARKTAQAFNDAGIPAGLILGEQNDDERDQSVADLESGNIRILCSIDVISEGFDIPEIDAVILLRPTKSLALYLQQIGRALRPAPGKSFAYVLDHAGNTLRHGFIDDEFEWTLDAGVKRKRPSVLIAAEI